MSKNLTDVFASTLYELANSEFPAEVVREARLCLLDFLFLRIQSVCYRLRVFIYFIIYDDRFFLTLVNLHI